MDGSRIITVPNTAAGFAVVWGIFALNPFADMFAKFPILYAPMLAIVGHEAFWGSLFACSGVSTWALNYFGFRRAAAFVMFVAFGFFGALYFIGDIASPGWGICAMFCILNLILALGGSWAIRH